MKTLVPKSSGFCPGVRRAEEGVLALRKEHPAVHLQGPLIHNQSYASFLESQNISVADPAQLKEGSHLVIRTHGISKDAEALLKQKFTLKDLTCPIVKRVQKKVEKADAEGAFVIISGKEAHAEVQGLKSYARHSLVLEVEDDLTAFLQNPALPEGCTKIFILSQTTHERPFFQKICEQLEQSFKNICPVEIADTICPVTENKEQESLALQKQADCTIVIGDPQSSNSKKLFQVLKNGHGHTHFIRTAADIPSLGLGGVNTALVVSSTSTPKFIEDEVLRALELL